MNPYDVLGLAPDATKKQIDEAYRRWARKLHPDHSKGCAEAFKKINAAYEILNDPEAKAHFDRTGNVQNKQRRLSQIEGLIGSMLDDAFTQNRFDPIRYMERKLDERRQSARDAARDGEELLERLRTRVASFRMANQGTTNKDSRDFIALALDTKVSEYQAAIAAANEDAELYGEALTYLNDLQCPVKNAERSEFSYMLSPRGGR